MALLGAQMNVLKKGEKSCLQKQALITLIEKKG